MVESSILQALFASELSSEIQFKTLDWGVEPRKHIWALVLQLCCVEQFGVDQWMITASNIYSYLTVSNEGGWCVWASFVILWYLMSESTYFTDGYLHVSWWSSPSIVTKQSLSVLFTCITDAISIQSVPCVGELGVKFKAVLRCLRVP